MIYPIMKDVLFLAKKSQPATAGDKQVALDLLETLKAHEEGCVGMAANMIGISKRIIAVNMGFTNAAMLNPVITGRKGKYNAMEGCLSLVGERPCIRYREIEVDYYDINFQKRHGSFSGWTAEIIQHEIDHCNGVII